MRAIKRLKIVFAGVIVGLVVLVYMSLFVAFKATNYDVIHVIIQGAGEIFFELCVFTFIPLLFVLAIPSGRKIVSGITTTIVLLDFSLDIFLVTYYLKTKYFFDYYYFWFHHVEVFETFRAIYPFLYARIAAVIAVFGLCTWALGQMRAVVEPYRTKLFRYAVVPATLLFIGTIVVMPGPPLKKLVLDGIATHRIINFSAYQEHYHRSLDAKIESEPSTKAITGSVVMLQQESLNSEFVTQEITPVMYELAKEGVLLTHHYSTAIQTKRSYEVTLCSSLPSISISARRDFSLSGQAGQLVCLPELLRRVGYTTLFFQNFDLAFQATGEFMSSVGFDEVHASDIMHEGDAQSSWGDREDVFFKRIAEYLMNRYPDPDTKLFVYILVGSTNHHPFAVHPHDIRADVYSKFPAGTATDYRSRRINTAFAQDAYLAELWTEMRKLPQFPSIEFFTYGDHPVAVNRTSPEYSFNAEGSEQANFQTAMLFVPSEKRKNEFAVGRVITEDIGTSHQGIAPTILATLGMRNPFPTSKSFYDVLRSDTLPKPSCVVNVQPYFHPAVALVQYPYKVVIQLLSGRIVSLDLTTLPAGAPEVYAPLENSLTRAGEYLKACIGDTLDTMLHPL